jgi:hypothetical protein
LAALVVEPPFGVSVTVAPAIGVPVPEAVIVPVTVPVTGGGGGSPPGLSNSTPMPFCRTGLLKAYWMPTVPLPFSMPTVANWPASDALSMPV